MLITWHPHSSLRLANPVGQPFIISFHATVSSQVSGVALLRGLDTHGGPARLGTNLTSANGSCSRAASPPLRPRLFEGLQRQGSHARQAQVLPVLPQPSAEALFRSPATTDRQHRAFPQLRTERGSPHGGDALA